MSKVIVEVGDKFPKTCEHCPLFIDHFGIPTYCPVAENIRRKKLKRKKTER